MKPMIPPVEFVSPLSEVEVRITLKELCGSQWEDYPFRGEVERNTFRFIRNNPTFSRGGFRLVLLGEYYEHNGKTKVSISLKQRTIASICISVMVFMAVLCAVVIPAFDEGLATAIGLIVTLMGFGGGILALNLFLIRLSFRRSVDKIKKALGEMSL